MGLVQFGLSVFIQASIIYAPLSIIYFFFSQDEAFSSHASYLKRFFFGLAGGGVSLLLHQQNIITATMPAGSVVALPFMLTTLLGGWVSGIVTLTLGSLDSAETVVGGVVNVFLLLFFILYRIEQKQPSKAAVLMVFALFFSTLLTINIFNAGRNGLYQWLSYSSLTSIIFLITYYLLMVQKKSTISSITIKNFAMIDNVTQLNNRKRVDQEISRLATETQPFAVGLIDLDDFKFVNDHYGHLVGDQLLFEVAEVFRATTRAKDFVGRYGGEEFIIFIRHHDCATVLLICQRIRQAVDNTLFLPHSPQPFKISVSIGITMRNPGDDLMHCLHVADQALYEAKKRGKNQVVLSNSTIDDQRRDPPAQPIG